MAEITSMAPMRTAGMPPRLSALGQWADRHFKWLLVAPAVALILALSIYPLFFSLVVSFINYDFQVPGHGFVGLRNFERVVADPVARWSLVVTRIRRRQSVGFLAFFSAAADYPRPNHSEPSSATNLNRRRRRNPIRAVSWPAC